MMMLKNILTILLLLCITSVIAQQSDTSVVSYRKPLFDCDVSKPIFKFTEEQQLNKNGFLRYTAFTGYSEGIEPFRRSFGYNVQTYDDAEKGTTLEKVYNVSIQELFTHGFNEPNVVSLEVKDQSRYQYKLSYGSKLEWLRKNAYCYESIVPIFNSGAEVLKMDTIFGNRFKVKFGDYKKHKMRCLILIRTSNLDKISSSGIGDLSNGKNGVFRNADLGAAIRTQLNAADMPPMIDQTGYRNKVDLNLGIKTYTNLGELRKALQRYDLDLKEEVRELDNIFYLREIE